MMATWNPGQYLRFSDQRLRPALDLLGRIELDEPKTIYDLGCGTGSGAIQIRARWPLAQVIGIDSSSTMLNQAKKVNSNIQWRLADLQYWSPDLEPSLLYSNAALHWLPNHETLFPRLSNFLTEGGVLAVQMPRNYSEPSHTAIFETIRNHDWCERLLPLLNEKPTQEPSFYYELLQPYFSSLDIWETQYYQIMTGEHPVVEFTKGSFLRPILEELNHVESQKFIEEYQNRVSLHYPRRTDGTTLLPFRRLFIVGSR